MLRLGTILDSETCRTYGESLPRCHDVQWSAVVLTDDPGAFELAAFEGEVVSLDAPCDLFERYGDQIDVVAIHGPPAERLESCRQAIRASKPVFAEFPVSLVPEELTQLEDELRETGGLLFVYYPMRFSAYSVATRIALRSEQLGRPGLLRMHDWHPASQFPGDTGRAALLAAQVDLACWYFDREVEVVFATNLGQDGGRTTVSQIHLGFADGGMALLDYASLPSTSDSSYQSQTLIGSQGASYADDHHNSNLILGEDWRALPVSIGAEHLWTQLEEFARQCSHPTANSDALANHRRVAHIIQSAFQSAKSGQSVEI